MSPDVIISAKNGNPDAMTMVINEYDPLVRFFAWKKNNPLYTDDYIQAGRVGVFKAVKKTDPERGGSFTSYAANFIKNEMALLTCEIKDMKWNDYVLLGRYYRRRREIEQQEHREIDMLEVFEGMNLQPSQVEILKAYVRRSLVSMDAHEMVPKDASKRIEVDALERLRDGRIRFVSEMIAQLTERQSLLVKRFYLDRVSQVQIAKEIDGKASYVGSAIRKIRIRLREKWPQKLFQIAFDSGRFYDPDFSFHLERWKPVKDINTIYMVSNYGRVRSYDRRENKFTIKHPNKDKGALRYRLNDSGKTINIPVSKIIHMHYNFEELPTFYEPMEE